MRFIAEQQIRIEQLKMFARIGVARSERARRQRLVLNITLWPARDPPDLQDLIGRTADYSLAFKETRLFLSRQSSKLLLTLPNDLAEHLIGKLRAHKSTVVIRTFSLKHA